jgi:hypothetical protein
VDRRDPAGIAVVLGRPARAVESEDHPLGLDRVRRLRREARGAHRIGPVGTRDPDVDEVRGQVDLELQRLAGEVRVGGAIVVVRVVGIAGDPHRRCQCREHKYFRVPHHVGSSKG